MSDLDRTRCREAARECVRLADLTHDPQIKATLLKQAQEWMKLAYSDSAAKHRELLAELNPDRMNPPANVQRQPMQQQQSRSADDKT